jgi:GMP synthase (glutamine-hydrolysing)
MEGPGFNSLAFIDHQIREIQSVLKNEKAIIACSGGVDSTTCAVLANRAVGRNLRCVFIDTNFMRLGEPEQVFDALSQPPLNLPVTVIDARERFMEALQGLTDAEAKRKAFRSTFYAVLSEVAREERCHFLVQGTILPDVLETVGGIKTQHNVLEQMKIDTREAYGFKVVEPLVSLYKHHVREVAKKLGISVESSERPPFPGPGLSVRVLGQITPEKLRVEKLATRIVEEKLDGLGSKQYFPAIIDDETQHYPEAGEIEGVLAGLINVAGAEITVRALKSRATGIKKGQRLYGRIVLIDIVDGEGRCLSQAMEGFDAVQRGVVERDGDASRVLYRLTDNARRGRWLIAVRAVETRDFVTARVSRIPWDILREMEGAIRAACPTVSAVYYDITPKPPSSIEFE